MLLIVVRGCPGAMSELRTSCACCSSRRVARLTGPTQVTSVAVDASPQVT
jgi:hypothetical protein